MSGMTREGRTAGRYWANALRTPAAAGNDPVVGNEASHEVALRIQTAAVLVAAANDPEAVNRFEAILAHNVSSQMSSGVPLVIISMQNIPDKILTSALAEVGIPEAAREAFPWMTTMKVKVGKVAVQEGIDAPFEDVPLLKRSK